MQTALDGAHGAPDVAGLVDLPVVSLEGLVGEEEVLPVLQR
jgi:hypothetical protein